MAQDIIDRAASYLAQCRLSGDLIGPPAGTASLDEHMAYLIQSKVHNALTDKLGTISGHKIGCTTPVMQRYLNISQPCAGGVFASTVISTDGHFPASRQGRLGVECELAVRLGVDLEASDGAYTLENVAPAVQTFMPAMEIVEDRYHDYDSLGAAALIADDFFNAGCVLGKACTDWQSLELKGMRGRMWVNEELRGEGVGADILGHPLQALAWLANHRAALGHPLRAGEFVLLGSVVQTQWLQAGDQVRIEIDGLGEADLHVSASG